MQGRCKEVYCKLFLKNATLHAVLKADTHWIDSANISIKSSKEEICRLLETRESRQIAESRLDRVQNRSLNQLLVWYLFW